jgi:Bacterial Ig-like domain
MSRQRVSMSTARRLTVAGVVLLAVPGPLAGRAYAYWDATNPTAAAAAQADSMPAGNRPVATFSPPATVTLAFGRAVTAGGRPVTTYLVRRYTSATATTPAGTVTCSWPAAGALSCVDSGVPAGQWYYTDTPRIAGTGWAGQESPRGTPVLVDGTAPTITVTAITPQAGGGGLYTASPVTVTLTAVDELGGSGVAGIGYQLDGAAQVSVPATTANVAVSGEGDHTLRYQATDNAGNTSATGSQLVRIDTVAPGAPTVTSYAGLVNQANQAAVAVSGTAEAGATVTVRVSGGSGTVTRTTTASGGAWSLTGVDLSGLPDGTLTYAVTATDLAGNTGSATALTAGKDTLAPSATVVVGPGNGSTGAIRSGGTYFAYASADDTAPGTVASVKANLSALTSGQTAVTLSASGGPFVLRGATYAYRGAALTAGTLTTGSKSVTVTATDAAGNVTTVTGTVTVDSTAPSPASITLANRTGGTAGRPENGDTITLRWSEEMDPATLYTGWSLLASADVAGTVTFTDLGQGNGTNKDTDTFAVTGPSGVKLGTVTGLDGRLVPTSGGSYAFAGTLHYTVTGAQSVVTVTLGTQTGAGTVGTVPGTSTVTGTWTPTAANTDLATNPVTGSVTAPAVGF